MQGSDDLDESLREMACLGSIDKVELLVSGGVNVNSQNSVNGWTALHWAARRNHANVVSYLLRNGANPTIASFNGELPGDVTQNEAIKQLLPTGQEMLPDVTTPAFQNSKANEQTSFIPNYLQNPEFPYLESATEFATRLGIAKKEMAMQGDGMPTSSPTGNYRKLENMPSDDSVLVLKCRLADSDEKDFIEIELDKKDLSFEALVELCVCEFGIDRTQLKKVRKLPNTVLRNDRDVKRLVQYQELELIID